jgi:hypothetical protein
MSRICIKCDITKSETDFYDNRNTCKACKNKHRTEYNREKKSIDTDTDSVDDTVNDNDYNLTELCRYHEKAHLVLLEPGSIHEKMTKYIEMLKTMEQKAMIIIDKTMIVLKLKIPNDLHEYLCQIKDDGVATLGCLRIAKGFLKNNDSDEEFEKHFGMNRPVLKKYIELIEDIDHITGFIRSVYQLLIDDVIIKRSSKFSRSSLDHDRSEVELKSSYVIRFDPDSDSIVTDNNPLHIDNTVFLYGLHNLINKKDNVFDMYVNLGFYDKFNNLLIK